MEKKYDGDKKLVECTLYMHVNLSFMSSSYPGQQPGEKKRLEKGVGGKKKYCKK